MKKIDFSLFTIEQKKSVLKGFSIVVILCIVMYYSISFAINSKNYSDNKVYDSISNSSNIYNGVYIEEVYVGGLNKEQAKNVADKAYASKRLDGNDMEFKTIYGYDKIYTFRELGGQYDIDSAVDEAYNTGRNLGKSKWKESFEELRDKHKFIPVSYSVNENVLKDTIAKIVEDTDKEYSLKGKKASYDKTYETVLKYLEIQEKDIEIYVPEEKQGEE